MRTRDLVAAAAGGLWRQKVRSALTLTGVAVGACSLAFSLSLGVGLRSFVEHEFRNRPNFWDITVYPNPRPAADESIPVPPDVVEPKGSFSAERTARFRETFVDQYRQSTNPRPPVPLDAAAVAKLAARPDVLEVRTTRNFFGRAGYDGRGHGTQFVATNCAAPEIAGRLVAGRLPEPGRGEALVSEWLLYSLEVRTEAGIAASIGRSIDFETGDGPRGRSLAAVLTGAMGAVATTDAQTAAADKLLAEWPKLVAASGLTAAEKAALTATPDAKPKRDSAAVRYTVVGILRLPTRAEYESRNGWWQRHAGVVVPPADGETFSNKVGDLPGGGPFQGVTVVVRPGADLPAEVAAVEAAGFGTHSSLPWYTAAKQEVTMIAAGLNVFALISLVVAALGITNTLVTSVVERTREIGILKSLGARDGHVLGLFLLEGTLVGLVGGVVGLAGSRLAAGPADSLVRRLIQEQSRGVADVSRSVFEFPPWLSAGTVVFAVAVTTLAALYPARRAAHIRPVEALRHE